MRTLSGCMRVSSLDTSGGGADVTVGGSEWVWVSSFSASSSASTPVSEISESGVRVFEGAASGACSTGRGTSRALVRERAERAAVGFRRDRVEDSHSGLAAVV